MSSTNKTPLEFTNANPDAEPKLRPMEPRHKDFLFYVADGHSLEQAFNLVGASRSAYKKRRVRGKGARVAALSSTSSSQPQQGGPGLDLPTLAPHFPSHARHQNPDNPDKPDTPSQAANPIKNQQDQAAASIQQSPCHFLIIRTDTLLNRFSKPGHNPQINGAVGKP